MNRLDGRVERSQCVIVAVRWWDGGGSRYRPAGEAPALPVGLRPFAVPRRVSAGRLVLVLAA